MRDGLSQTDRQKRVDSVMPFAVIDDRPESFLKQAEMIAGLLRYYGLDGKHDGYFDQFLPEIKNIRENQGQVILNGTMEPSQALLFTFLNQLQSIVAKFNERWNRYAFWYMDNLLKINSLPPCPDTAWITLSKGRSQHVRIPEGTGFCFSGAGTEEKVYYRTTESIRVTEAGISKAYAMYFEKNKNIYPACLFDVPTALQMTDLLNATHSSGMLFGTKSNTGQIQPLGIRITSPSLLLREGKRHITLAFKTEQSGIGNMEQKRHLVKLIRETMQKLAPITKKDAKEVTLMRVFRDIFYLEISIPEGWKSIGKYVISREDEYKNALVLKFELTEDFPATSGCSSGIHQEESRFPALRILLNRDSWLFPYHWLKTFYVAKIILKAQAKDISNILYYNELGRVDNSVPFAPFGINTERGAWFAIGNYEMAVKNVQTADVHIRWQQLPDNEGGMFSYYEGYRNNTDNRSFKLRARYLTDYKWKKTDNPGSFFLFSSSVKDREGNPEPQYKLAEESVFENVQLGNMKPLFFREEDYHYDIQSKTGFFSFLMEEPEMGFGEKRYRRLFSEQMIKKALRKKKTNWINPPITPMIERITLSYVSVEEIDFRSYTPFEHSRVAHIYPFGEEQVYPATENQPVPFVFSPDTDANVLFGLKNINGDEFVNVYIDFLPQKKEVPVSLLPQIRWYWGDGYRWKVLPDDAIRKNTTQNLLVSGGIKIYLPEISESGFRDKDGLVWIRAGITRNEKSISGINRIFTNAVRVQRDPSQMQKNLLSDYILDTPELNLPGIETITQITSFSGGQPEENENAKLIRISEFISHRGHAVTPRDFERMTLQAFPEVRKVKCLPNVDAKSDTGMQAQSQGVVTLVIISGKKDKSKYFRPGSSPGLLLNIEKYFQDRISGFVTQVDAINPEYETILVRCAVDFHASDQSRAFLRSTVRKVINRIIAPWQVRQEDPVFGYSFGLQQMYDRINELKYVHRITHLSVVQLSAPEGTETHRLREYFRMENVVAPTKLYAIMVPAHHHIILPDMNEKFGIPEMEINENFVIWQKEVGKH